MNAKSITLTTEELRTRLHACATLARNAVDQIDAGIAKSAEIRESGKIHRARIDAEQAAEAILDLIAALPPAPAARKGGAA